MVDVESLFYKSDSSWFGWLANIAILTWLAVTLVAISWILYRLLSGICLPGSKKAEDEQIQSLTKDLSKAYTTQELKLKDVLNDLEKIPVKKERPFGPGSSRDRAKQAKQPAKHSA